MSGSGWEDVTSNIPQIFCAKLLSSSKASVLALGGVEMALMPMVMAQTALSLARPCVPNGFDCEVLKVFVHSLWPCRNISNHNTLSLRESDTVGHAHPKLYSFTEDGVNDPVAKAIAEPILG